MAKKTVVPSKLDYNGDVIIAAQALDALGAEIDPIAKCSNLAILVENTDSDILTVTIPDGANFTGGTIGDLTVSVAGTSQHWIGPLEGHRFLDGDGMIQMTFATTGTLGGTVAAIELK